jgi:hypothetical protein
MLFPVLFPMTMLAAGLVIGGLCMFLLVLERDRRIRAAQRRQKAQEKTIIDSLQAISATTQQLNQRTEEFRSQQELFNKQAVSYADLQHENSILKRDLQNIDVNLRKLEMDGELHRQVQAKLDQRAQELGHRYLKDNIKWILKSLGENNFAACKQKLAEVISRSREIGFVVSSDEEASLLSDLKAEFEKLVRAAFEREEQARIKAQIREEERLKREVERELAQLERERAAIKAALEKALADAQDKHSEEVERLKVRLAEAEAKTQRAMSQAQMTKSGNVYVISNIGSFGKGVYKIGMTRRLDPQDRVHELSNAAVPFPFDVHMMVSSDDAPGLENALHRAFHKARINKANPRKEFFKVDIEDIHQVVKEHHGEVQYVADAEALEYNQSLTMSAEDSEYIEHTFESVSGNARGEAEDV